MSIGMVLRNEQRENLYAAPVPLLHVVLLGIVQGLTEFLPISSDGHLVVFETFFPWSWQGRDALGFDILLHGASLLALLLLYARTWWRLLRAPFVGDCASTRLLLLLLLTAVPGAIAGLLLEDIIAFRLRSIVAAALGFLVTAAALLVGERIGRRRAQAHADGNISLARAVLLGCAQAVALLPGVSRSGLTISAARLFGIPRREAVDLSFLMAAPIIGGAVGKTLLDAWSGSILFPPLPVALVGFLATFIVSAVAIVTLRSFVKTYSLALFAWYLVPLALFLFYDASGLQQRVGDLHTLALLVHRYGALVIFITCFLEVIPPISFVSPGILLLVIAGSMAQTSLSLFLFLGAATCGLMLGNMLLFRLGYYFGHDIARHMHLTEERLHVLESFMRRFGRINIFIGQFVGLIRPGVAFVAGTARMPVLWYYPWMVVSSMLWAAVYLFAGFLLRTDVAWLLPALVGVGVLVYLLSFLLLGAEMYVARSEVRQRK